MHTVRLEKKLKVVSLQVNIPAVIILHVSLKLWLKLEANDIAQATQDPFMPMSRYPSTRISSCGRGYHAKDSHGQVIEAEAITNEATCTKEA